MRITIFCCFVLAAMTSRCTYDHAEQVTCAPPDTVSFSRDIQPIFDAHCNDISCHVGYIPAGNLNLESGQAYEELQDRGSGYIDTVQPNFSLLYAQMISVSQPMPPSGNLDECTTGLVLKWIEQKARNN